MAQDAHVIFICDNFFQFQETSYTISHALMVKQSSPKKNLFNPEDLKCIKSFLSNARNNVSFSPDQSNVYSGWWIIKGKFISLNSEGREKYRCVLQKIRNKFPEEDISESAIGRALINAVFECVDIPENKLSARVEKALEELRKNFEASPEEYECWVEVSGLDPSSLPEAFGAVRFVIFDEEQIDSIETKNAGDQQAKPETIDRDLTKTLSGKTTAVVEVKAHDRSAAEKLAERKVRTTLECMNFFSDLRPASQVPCQFLSVGRKPPAASGRLIVSSSGEVPYISKILNDEPATPFSIARLRQCADGEISEAISRTEELLKKRKTNNVEDLLLRSVCLGGRAGVKRTREESFLMFMIALECLILPKQGMELSYRLSQRAAWFLGNTPDKRKDIKKLIKKLYRIRSKIVHSGVYEVPEEKYHQAYEVVKISIFKMLTNQDIGGLSSLDKLDDWFEKLNLDLQK